MVLERTGYAAVIHEAITLDIATNPANVSLAWDDWYDLRLGAHLPETGSQRCSNIG